MSVVLQDLTLCVLRPDPVRAVRECVKVMTSLEDKRFPENPDGCFVAGTLVWTDQGPVPIEQIKVGDRVLSQPEAQGERNYRQVVRTFSFEDKEIWHFDYVSMGSDLCTVFGTGNHPVWVAGKGWTAIEALESADKIELQDGTVGYVAYVGIVYATPEENIGFVRWDDGDECIGNRVDFLDNFRNIEPRDFTNLDYVSEDIGVKHFRRRVYNLEVEGFHTYYVGELGVWVHNTNCASTAQPDSYRLEARDPARTALLPAMEWGQVFQSSNSFCKFRPWQDHFA